MPHFAANLSTMFPELPAEARFQAARDLGFTAVEYSNPYELPAARIRTLLDETGLEMVLINTPPTDAGEPGLAAVPDRAEEFQQGYLRALEYAVEIGVPMIHLMAGIVTPRYERVGARHRLAANAYMAAESAAPHGIEILLEPLNDQDMPDYYLTELVQARQIIDEAGREDVRLQFDFYHRQVMEGNLARNLKENLDIIGHVQFSSVPGRHEPQYGEVNLPFLFDFCDTVGYDGWIGCEYSPKTTVAEGLSWGAPYGLGTSE